LLQEREKSGYRNNFNILAELREWALTENVNHCTINSLLVRLKKHDCFKFDLPADARTLLNTPRTIFVRKISPGEYHHFGIKNGIFDFLKKHPTFVGPINVSFHVDGLPISKSTQSQLWPILGSVVNHKFVFVIGLYHSFVKKPNDVCQYLQEFVEDTKDIVTNGIEFDGKVFECIIKTFIADTPAKAFCLQIKSHTGYFSCTKCKTEGEFITRMCFPDINAPRRTHEEFVLGSDESYHTGITPLKNIPNFSFINNIPSDYMHLVLLGTMKKLIALWIRPGGPLSVRMRSKIVEDVSTILIENIRPVVPSEFQRKPSALNHFSQWKAVDFRMFLLYTGVGVLKNKVQPIVYNHFVTLHVAISLLSVKDQTSKNIDYSEKLLQHFVKSFGTIYGVKYISHNIHGLIHLSEDVRNHGALDNFSAFKFENFMQQFLKMLRKDEKPLQQIIKRYNEMLIKPGQQSYCCDYNLTYPKLSSSKRNADQFTKIKFQHFTISTLNKRDNGCLMKNGEIVLVKKINYDTENKCHSVVGNSFLVKNDLYVIPCKSSYLGIFCVSKLSQSSKTWPINYIDKKMFIYKMSSITKTYAALPMF